MSHLIYKYEAIKRAAELSTQQMQSLEPLVNEILTRVVIETISKYQKKLNVGIQDSVSDLLDDYKQKVIQDVLCSAEAWRLANKSDKDPVVFPRGCRFCWTKGENTIFIVEQDPQIRSISFMKGILGDIPLDDDNKEYIRLALPYVVFIVHFRRGRFHGMYCGWKNQQITSLDDMLYHPLLPNIHHSNLNVCMADWEKSGTITQQSMNAIDSFWNSTFNDDLSSMWWKKWQFHEALRTAYDWHKKSLEDSSFILDINLQAVRTIRDILNLLVMYDGDEPEEAEFSKKLQEDIEYHIDSFFGGIMRHLKNTKFEKYHPTDITDTVKLVLESSFKQLADVVFALDVEIQKLKDELCVEEKQVVGIGSNWR